MENSEKVKRLVDEFEMKLKRRLTKKEIDFLESIVQSERKRDMNRKKLYIKNDIGQLD